MLHLALVLSVGAITAASDDSPLKFERQRIGDVTYEACCIADINNDGKKDIVSGEYWFEGPDFTASHKICTIRRELDYYDDFSDYPMDVNGDGYVDIVTGGWFGETLSWRENPKGQPVEWTTHEIAKCGNIERPMFYDIDGDGDVEVIPNLPGTKYISIFKLVRDSQGKGTGQFKETKIYENSAGHGMGFGDINGDKHVDIVLPWGWLEAPADTYTGTWIEHRDTFNLGGASCPILTYDVNKDGKNDIIVGQGHDYGLHWYEQKADGTWEKHDIDTERSQYHDMMLVDVNNDGVDDVVTGKRYRAHQEHDPGSLDPVGVYYFTVDGGKFTRNTVDYGPADQHSGVGIFCWVEDIDGNGWKDILAPGKEGMYLFKNMGK
ncbi:MAG: VCBS repeat-containing protein [Candidatus Hydrogenedentes bacterium]|nr:VCBS repeat-containing protein [Candidatus Hydrogenedentota bacterium]